MQHGSMTGQETPGVQIRVIAAAILLVTLVGISLAVANPLVSLEMERWGVTGVVSGLTATAAGLGTVIAVPLVPRLARRLGVPIVLGASLAIAAGAMALFPFFANVIAWAIIRFVLGCVIGVIFTLSEFWINAAAAPRRRGLIMGIYATALYAGFASGPLLLTLLGTQSALPYLVTAAIMMLGLVPLLLAGGNAPRIDRPASASVLRLVVMVPTATVGALVFGAIETGVVTLLPVHNVRLGYGETDATLLLSAFTLGNVLFQLPIGYLSDRMDRRRLLLGLASLSCLAAALLPQVQAHFWPYASLLFVFGGVSGAIYGIGLAHLGSRFDGADLASANAAFVLLYSLGLMIGPPAVGIGMDRGGGFGLPLALTLLLGFYALLVLARLRFRQD
jgi:MFS family permease